MSLYRTFHHKKSNEAASFRWIMVNKVHHSHKLLGIIKKSEIILILRFVHFALRQGTHIIPNAFRSYKWRTMFIKLCIFLTKS